MQPVVVNGYFSDWRMIDTGVPQGFRVSIVFWLYINELDLGIQSQISKCCDNTKLWSIEDDTNQLQHDLDSLAEWANECQMRLRQEHCIQSWYHTLGRMHRFLSGFRIDLPEWPELTDFRYNVRLQKLASFTLEQSRSSGILMEVYKIKTGLDEMDNKIPFPSANGEISCKAQDVGILVLLGWLRRMKCTASWNKNKHLFRFASVVLILLILSFHWNELFWISLQLDRFHMKVSLPIQATQCSTWQSNNLSEQILPKFIRNTNLFLSIDGDWWHKPNYLYHTFPYGIKGNEVIVKKILVRIQSHMPDEIDRLKCKRCVIVGNGNTLRNSSIGQTINEYDVVIRLNNAPVRGYEKDVGNKTTLRIFYPESATEDPTVENNLDTLFVLVPFKTVDVRWLKAIVYNETKVTSGFWKRPSFLKNLDPVKVRMLNPFYMSQAAIQFLGKPDMIRQRRSHPTTGLLAITLGLNYCDEVHAAGFGYPLNQKNGLIHYFDRLNMKQMSFDTIHLNLHSSFYECIPPIGQKKPPSPQNKLPPEEMFSNQLRSQKDSKSSKSQERKAQTKSKAEEDMADQEAAPTQTLSHPPRGQRMELLMQEFLKHRDTIKEDS
ncbi:uncharacterized protein LOC119954013 [Scyliorhinus canicula]|uniref:uncharacterized protein LOC119954013 n=1 Tax=Scyliorhinus canicula TaxID=7830 RepID=UPI0018F35104|nr:uncharacterized protein LOC119954013 [Scyliorhinus canicula]